MKYSLQSAFPNELRPDLRKNEEARPLKFELNIAPNAAGSVLVSQGNTRVICAANFEKKIPPWMIQQNITGGWLTAEYTMLPYSTLDRKPRESARGKSDGRSIEIQRLIGRSLRAILDLKKIPNYTLYIDCDVLQADGSTRVASINGAYIAAQLAVRKMLEKKLIPSNPFKEAVGALSVGILEDTMVIDPCFLEDKDARLDCTIVLTSSLKIIEVQASGEQDVFTEEELYKTISMAKAASLNIFALQEKILNI